MRHAHVPLRHVGVVETPGYQRDRPGLYPQTGGASFCVVGVAAGASAGRTLGNGTADGEMASAMAITFGRWRGSGISPVSGATVGKSALAPSFDIEVVWSCPDGVAAIFPGGIAGGLVVGLGQAKSWLAAGGAAA